MASTTPDKSQLSLIDQLAPKDRREPIAVVGVSALFPGSADLRGFWRDIVAGRDMIKDVPPNYWLIEDYYDPDPTVPDKTYCKRGAFLDKLDFDPVAFGIPPTILPTTDTAQLLALVMAKRVLEDACQGDFKDMDTSRVSCILGVAAGLELLGEMASRLQRPIWTKAMREAGLPETEVQDICDRIISHFVDWKESTFPGLLGNVVAGRIANRFDLGGTNCTTDAACASSFSALSMGVNELWLGHSDAVITGGVDTTNDPFLWMCFSKTPALSRTGDCRPFSEDADGTILGEGVGMVLLKRLSDAERDGDRIYSVIRGVGSSSDGRAKSVYAPRSIGQASALRRAYEMAGYGPETVELVEAHGTGTGAGDVAEADGLKMVFSEARDDGEAWCQLGSVKSQIGHTKSTAGAAGLIKVVMALNNKVLPPTIKVSKPKAALALEGSPLYLNTTARPWVRGSDHLRRGSVSSFGFGGTNFHLAVEEYDGANGAGRQRIAGGELVLLSAASAADLVAACKAVEAEAQAVDSLRFIARSRQAAFDPTASHRLALVASDEDELRRKLNLAAGRIGSDGVTEFALPGGVRYASGEATPGKVAFLFPGQGSQYLGMGAELAMNFDVVRATWDRHSGFPADDTPLHDVVWPRTAFDDDAREAQSVRLTATEWAQPAIGAVSLSMLALVNELGLEAQATGGHSFGEVTALAAAGVLDEATALTVARTRGELMAAEAARSAGSDPAQRGSMTAVSWSRTELEALLAELGSDVVIANHNSPEQLVVSGAVASLDAVEQALQAKGVRAKRLPVATAFHSTLVAGAAEPFAKALAAATFQAGSLPVYANSEAAPYPDDAAARRALLAGQIARPVRFAEQIVAMADAGIDTFVEIGPRDVLTKLVGACLSDRPHLAVALDRRGVDGTVQLMDGLGALAVAGHALDFDALWAGYREEQDPATRKQPRMAVSMDGANLGRPYPPEGGAPKLPAPNPARPTPEPVIVTKTVEVPVEVPVEVRVEVPVGAPAQPGVPAAAARSAYAPAATSPGALPGWLTVYQQVQQQTAEIHAAHLQMMSQSHQTFLQTADFATQQMVTALTGAPAGFVAAPATAAPPAPQPVPVFAPAVTSAARAPVAAAPPAPAPARAAVPAAPAPTPAPTPAPARSPVQTVTPVPAAPPARVPAVEPTLDLRATLLGVVADKTGYPVDILDVTMGLESDLGIDSIKRVEILSALNDEVPGLPEVDASEMGRLQTLGDVLGYLEDAAPSVAAGAATSIPTVAAAAPAAAAQVDLRATLLDVVADKTGYPVDILDVSMGLESDLGIDSIKRVEILSALNDEVPGLPEVDASEMGRLQTLGDVLGYLEDAAPAGPAMTGPAAPAATAPTTPVATAATAGIDLRATLLAVVADKTGYPVDVLDVSMALEGDLGIDSIKRVEILSALNDEVPGLPEVDASEMGRLQTLGDVLGYLEDAAPGAVTTAPAAPPQTAAPAPAAVPGLDLNAVLLAVVADKTGYPVDVLDASMALEGDLGIDSIKRVEILSALNDRVPGLPEVDASEMGRLQTLGDVLGYLEGASGAAATAPAPAAATAPAPAAATAHIAAPPAAAGAGLDLNAVLLDVVADKTGYPVDVLDASMALEGDLGIDSIKRVEILSALNDRVPGLPEVDASEMGRLQTLGDVLGYLEGASRGTAPPGPAPAAATETAAVATSPDSARYEVRAVPAPALGFATAGLTRGSVSLLGGGAIAEALREVLAEHGVDVALSQDELPASDAAGVICLQGLEAFDSDDAARAVNATVFRAARAVAASMTERGGLFVTVQDTGGDFGLRGELADAGRAGWTGGLAALARTASIEWPRAAVKAIDVERSGRDAKALAAVIAAELLDGGPELEVGLRADGTRWTLETVASQVEVATSAPLTAEDVLVVSGGARGVTAHCLVEIARRWQPRMVLLGRTPLADEPAWATGAADQPALMRNALTASKKAGDGASPADVKRRVSRVLAGREVRSTLAALGDAGSEVRYDAVDVTDGQAVGALLDEVRGAWGPVTGLIHAAGVLADKSIVDKTDEQFARVFDTKVGGLAGLLDATAEDPLRRLCVFSSVAARYGNGGQCDYAMANAILGNIASRERARRGGDFQASSMAWGPWNGGMVTPALAAHFERQGVALIALDAGARACADELANASADTVEVVIGGPKPPSGPAERPGQDARPIEVRVGAASYPYLSGHRVKDVAVVPVVLALEWFTRAARSLFPHLKVVNCRDLKVLKGIRLDHFDGTASDVFSIRWRQIGNGTGATISLELVGPGEVRHYSATVELAVDARRGERFEAPAMKLEPLKVAAGSLYGDKLFHGAEFAVIREVDGVSNDGGAAVLAGTREMGWKGDAWQTDAAALDGGLQLAILWGDHVLGRSSLPTRVGTYTPHTDEPVEGPIRCVLKGKSARGERTVSDIAFVDDDGRLVAELTDVEMHLLPKS